jgi:hypothetical protein
MCDPNGQRLDERRSHLGVIGRFVVCGLVHTADGVSNLSDAGRGG